MAGTTSDKLNLLRQIKEAFRAAIIGKGQTISDDEPYSAWPAKVAAIETGVQLPTLTSPGGAADLRQGKQLIDQSGAVVDGALANVEQATPTLSVDSDGWITASATQKAGLVAEGTKAVNLQLTSSNDVDFVAANIKKGVNIFGVDGSLDGWEVCRFSNYSEVPSHDLIDQITIDLASRIGTLTITLKEAVSEVVFFNAIGGPFDDMFCDFFVFEVPEIVADTFLASGNAYGFYYDEDGNLESYSSVEWELFADRKTIQVTAFSPSWNGPYPNTTHVCGYLAVKK